MTDEDHGREVEELQAMLQDAVEAYVQGRVGEPRPGIFDGPNS